MNGERGRAGPAGPAGARGADGNVGPAGPAVSTDTQIPFVKWILFSIIELITVTISMHKLYHIVLYLIHLNTQEQVKDQ